MKKHVFNSFLFSCLFIFTLTFNAFAQEDKTVLQHVITKLKTLSTDLIIEKCYIHFDKPSYQAGDTMYFKAYVTLGERADLSKLSGILYVDLINSQNQIINTLKLQLIDGLAWGDFVLNNSIPSGDLRVRAFTNYMKNNKDYFFNKTIPFVSKTITENTTLTNSYNDAPDIQFFPEGGDLVNGIISKVGFKAIGKDGLGINAKGVLLDNLERVVGKFNSTHLGMGVFNLLPEDGKSYKAKVTFSDGSKSTFTLPKPLSKGIVLAIIDTLNRISIEIHCNKEYFKENINKQLNLLIYSGGKVSSLSTKLDSRILSLDVPNNTFSSGIVQVTLFSQSGMPLSERILFIQNDDLVNLKIKSNKEVYSIVEKPNINISAVLNTGVFNGGHFSIAITDEGKFEINENSERTILSDLLFTSNLKGNVEQANYYFIAGKNRSADLDALMLTQAYRRFTWNQLLENKYSSFSYLPEKTLQINGKVKSTSGNALINKDILLRQSVNPNFLTTKTNENGRFSFNNLVFMDGTQFILQASGSVKEKNESEIILDKEGLEPVSGNYHVAASVNGSPAKLQENGNRVFPSLDDGKTDQTKSIPLKNVIVKEKKVESYASSNLSGSGHADQVIFGEDIKNSSTLSSALNGKLHGIDIQQGVPSLRGRAVFTGKSSVSSPMLIIIDGAILGSGSSIDNISPSNVETIEVLKDNNSSIYGEAGSNGVLIITSKHGSINEVNAGNLGSLKFTPKGFYRAREFYQPKYHAKESNGSNSITTIFWNPELLLNKDGNTSFTIPNGERPGNYRIVIEGIDNSGNIGRQAFNYIVK